jgi:hypothetical protein
MLVNTNDAFTGLDSLRVHGKGAVIDAIAYDAGSERNNKLAAFIPGPCCNKPFVRDPEGALIRPHDGITGIGDLDPAVYGWPEPAARHHHPRAVAAPVLGRSQWHFRRPRDWGVKTGPGAPWPTLAISRGSAPARGGRMRIESSPDRPL